jgi:hypothetical protein
MSQKKSAKRKQHISKKQSLEDNKEMAIFNFRVESRFFAVAPDEKPVTHKTGCCLRRMTQKDYGLLFTCISTC